MIAPPLLAAALALLPWGPGELVVQRSAPDYTFTKVMRRGETLSIGNIDGSVTVTRAAGTTAEIFVTKRVIQGDGDLVKALVEESEGKYRVCTVYLRDRSDARDRCDERRNDNHWRRREPLEVEMTYEVRLPEGVELDVATVDGDVIVSGLGASARVATVDGSVRVTGRAPERISTVDGDIELDAVGTLPRDMRVSTVDGSVLMTLPASAGFEVNATTVDGSLQSEFPLTVRGRWGPRSMRGRVGDASTIIRISTIDGDVTIRQR